MPERIALAFSGGLDTSFCVPWLKDRYNAAIVTVTVDTGGLADGDRAHLEATSRSLGAERHVLLEAREAYFEETLRHLIAGQRAPRQRLPPLRRRRAWATGAPRRGRRARGRRGRRRPRLHRGRQRPGALRGRAAHPRAGARDPRPDPRRGVLARRRRSPTSPSAASRGRRSAPPTRSTPGCGAARSADGRRPTRSSRCPRRPGCSPVAPSPRRAPGVAHVASSAAIPRALDGRDPCARGDDRDAERPRGRVRDRPRHPPRRHDHRPEGAGRIRGAGRRCC